MTIRQQVRAINAAVRPVFARIRLPGGSEDRVLVRAARCYAERLQVRCLATGAWRDCISYSLD